MTYPVIYCNKYLVYIGNITSSTILKYILLKSKLEVMKRKKRSIFCDKKEKNKDYIPSKWFMFIKER